MPWALGDVIAIYVPVPECGYRVFYRIIETGFDGPYLDETCQTKVEICGEG